jgi:hypothetical protein
VFLVISSILATMWRAAAARRHLLRPEIDNEQIQAILRGAAPNIGLYAVATLVAFPRAMGKTSADAIAEFALAYADQNEQDYQALIDAETEGRIAVERGV